MMGSWCGLSRDCFVDLRSSVRSLGWRRAAGVLATLFACPHANAQSFLDSLFGLGAAKPSIERPAGAAPRRTGRPPYQSRSFKTWMSERHQSTRADAEDYRRDPAFGGAYRTVCVRMCDGYYWPVSRSVRRERFAVDARRCESSCAGDARLYYQHRDSQDPGSMIDMEGRGYASLKTAFLYRRSLISGCGCRPAPWSVAETYRHHTYAAAEAAKALQEEMARQRAIAEAFRRDKIAQIIAATEAATALDAAEAAGEDVVAIDAPPAPATSLTGYTHLHVLPTDDALLPQPEPPVTVADLEAALAEIAVSGLPETPSAATLARAAEARRVRKARARMARAKSPKAVQTTSLFGGWPLYNWLGAPGSTP